METTELINKLKIIKNNKNFKSLKKEIESLVNEYEATPPMRVSQNAIRARLVEKHQRIAKWKRFLATTVADYYNCVVQETESGEEKVIRFVGLPENVAKARKQYHEYIKTINLLTDSKWELTRDQVHLSGRTWKNDFRLGAVQALSEKLKETKTKTGEAYLSCEEKEEAKQPSA